MNYNFTDRVRKVLSLAREEADRLRHDYVGTEHILLGLIREGEGVAAAVFSRLAVDLDEIRGKIKAAVEKGHSTEKLDEIPYRPAAKKVLEYSIAEARDLYHSYVGTEHLLLGILRAEEGIAAQVMASAGLTYEETRSVTLSVLGADDAPSESEEDEWHLKRLMARIVQMEVRLKALSEKNEKLEARIRALEERPDQPE